MPSTDQSSRLRPKKSQWSD